MSARTARSTAGMVWKPLRTDCEPFRFAQRVERLLVRPPDELSQIGFRKAVHLDDRDPTKASPVSGRLYARNIRQLDESIGLDSYTETPLFREACFEVGEFLATDSVHEKIA